MTGTGVAVWARRASMAFTLPDRDGTAEISSATAPATCGPAIEVPLMLP